MPNNISVYQLPSGEWARTCPKCGKTVVYSGRGARSNAIARDRLKKGCNDCPQKRTTKPKTVTKPEQTLKQYQYEELKNAFKTVSFVCNGCGKVITRKTFKEANTIFWSCYCGYSDVYEIE